MKELNRSWVRARSKIIIIIIIVIIILYLSSPIMGLFRDNETNNSNRTLNG